MHESFIIEGLISEHFSCMIVKLIFLNRNDYYLKNKGFDDMKKIIVALLSVTVLLTACSTSDERSNDPSISVYTTVYPLQYFTERIGGDFVTVDSIYPPGSDEHTFEPTQKDMMTLADADLFFYIGLGLEGFVDNAEKTLKNEHVKLVPTAQHIPDNLLIHSDDEHHDDEHEHNHHGHDHDHDHGDIDPHVWISPTLAQYLAEDIKKALQEALPTEAQYFEDNFKQLTKELAVLDEQFKQMAYAAKQKSFYVSHAAFGYIAVQYGLEQVAIAGLHSQSEPSQKELIDLVEKAKAENVQYVLFEQNISSKITQTIQHEIGAQSLSMHNLSVLTTADIKQKEDYLSLMEQNVETLKKALQ